MATETSTSDLRKMYADLAVRCVRRVNAIRKMAGRSDLYTMRDFTADTRADIACAGGPMTPMPSVWVHAARSRAIDLGA